MELEFDEADHIHRMDGAIVPGVTSILNWFFPEDYGQYYRERGKALHLACALSDAGRLNRSTVHVEIAGKVLAWEKFRKEWNRPVIARELQVGHPTYKYAGVLDAVFDGQDKFHVVCDLKSSLTKKVDLQLAAYSLAWKAKHPRIATRGVAIQLNNDGTYRCHWLRADEMRRNEQSFLNFLGTFNWIKTNYPNLKGTTNGQAQTSR